MLNIIRCTDHGLKTAILAAAAWLAVGTAAGQAPAAGSPAATPPADWTALSPQALDELVGPIALYPDDLIAVVLPAATYPLQIVQASRYLEDRQSDPSLEPDAEWDDSVVALLNYPEALALLNGDLDWTWELGEAVIYQQGDVLNAIQSFRDRAHAAGNLSTDDRQVVATEADGAITIAPADPEVIYVPYYDPARVVVHQHVPVYHYHPYAYPVYYYPYPSGYTFGSGFFWGVTSAFLVSWHDHYLHVRHHSHFGHPYYGHRYYTPWYARTNLYVNVNYYDSRHYWRPGYRHGGRPQHRAGYAVRYDGSDRRMRTTQIRDWRGDATTGNARDRRPGRVVDDRDVRRTRDGRFGETAGRADDDNVRRMRDTRPQGGGSRRVVDDAELRRLRARGSARSDIRADAGTPRERSLADAYRRPREEGGRITRTFGGTRPDAGRVTRSYDPGARAARSEPNRARVMPQMRTPSTVGRVAPAPAQRAPATSRPAQGREQPTSWPGARNGGGAPHAQPGTRPMPPDAGARRGGGRLQINDRGQRRR